MMLPTICKYRAKATASLEMIRLKATPSALTVVGITFISDRCEIDNGYESFCQEV